MPESEPDPSPAWGGPMPIVCQLAVLIGVPEDKWVVASSAGYGFVVKLGELYANKKAGKTALRVPEGGSGTGGV